MENINFFFYYFCFLCKFFFSQTFIQMIIFLYPVSCLKEHSCITKMIEYWDIDCRLRFPWITNMVDALNLTRNYLHIKLLLEHWVWIIALWKAEINSDRYFIISRNFDHCEINLSIHLEFQNKSIPLCYLFMLNWIKVYLLYIRCVQDSSICFS